MYLCNRNMLFQAVRDGHVKLVKILLEGGRDANLETFNGGSLLSTAILSGKDIVSIEKILRLLLQHGADINKRDKNGRTPLISAVMSDQASIYIMSLLLEKGADLSIKDTCGFTAIDYARKSNNCNVFEFLRSHMLSSAFKARRSQIDKTTSSNCRRRTKFDKDKSNNVEFYDLCKEPNHDEEDDDTVLDGLGYRCNNNPESSTNDNTFLPSIRGRFNSNPEQSPHASDFSTMIRRRFNSDPESSTHGGTFLSRRLRGDLYNNQESSTERISNQRCRDRSLNKMITNIEAESNSEGFPGNNQLSYTVRNNYHSNAHDFTWRYPKQKSVGSRRSTREKYIVKF